MTPHEMLGTYPLFALLGYQAIDEWLSAGKEWDFPTGETIFQEGTSGSWAYLILQGRVRVLRRTSTGRDVSVGLLGPGEIFGDYALLPPHNNTATCRSADATRVLRLPLSPLRAALGILSKDGGPPINLKRWLRLHSLLSHLQERSFLGFMSAPSALKYLDYLVPQSFQAMRTIQVDGLAEDRWYFIEKGSVALHLPDEPMRELGPGDCFGERGLAGRRGLPEAVALTETHCQCLPRSAFDPQRGGPGDSSAQSIGMHLHLPKSFPWIGQQEEADCGVAVLAMLARYHGRSITPQELRCQVRFCGRGLTLLELKHLAGSAGMMGQAVRADRNHLADVSLPAIAHFANGHYVVVFVYGPGRLVVGDPATSIVTLSESEFQRQWSGYLLLLAPIPQAPCLPELTPSIV